MLAPRGARDAVRKNLVPRNVADAADPPKLNRADREEMKTWTPEQLRKFFDGIVDHRLAAAYILAATTGMRRGEVLGVRWRDIDFKLATPPRSPNRALRRVSARPSADPRPCAANARSRSMPRPSECSALTARPSGARSNCSAPATSDHGLVFAREDGDPVHPDYFSQTFDRTVKRLKLPKIRLHDLRHTHATLGLAAGVHVKVIVRPTRSRHHGVHAGHLHARDPRRRGGRRRPDRRPRVRRLSMTAAKLPTAKARKSSTIARRPTTTPRRWTKSASTTLNC